MYNNALLLCIVNVMNFHRHAHVRHDSSVSQLHRRVLHHHQLSLLFSHATLTRRAIHSSSFRGYTSCIRHHVTRPATHARRASRVHQRHPAPATATVRNILPFNVPTTTVPVVVV